MNHAFNYERERNQIVGKHILKETICKGSLQSYSQDAKTYIKRCDF
jgi:hypothetical protein